MIQESMDPRWRQGGRHGDGDGAHGRHRRERHRVVRPVLASKDQADPIATAHSPRQQPTTGRVGALLPARHGHGRFAVHKERDVVRLRRRTRGEQSRNRARCYSNHNGTAAASAAAPVSLGWMWSPLSNSAFSFVGAAGSRNTLSMSMTKSK